MKKEYFILLGVILILVIVYMTGGSSMTAEELRVKEEKPKNVSNIPLEDFFKNPEMASFKLSPNGEYISYMKPWKEGNRMMNVYIRPINSDKEVRVTNASERSLYGYFWLSDNRIAYIQDEGGDENIHIFAVNIDGSNNNLNRLSLKILSLILSKKYNIGIRPIIVDVYSLNISI